MEPSSYCGGPVARPYIEASKSVNWGTPDDIKERFDGWFDPCPHPRPNWCGLSIPWPSKVFVNPPFNRLDLWAEKCAVEHLAGAEITLLMPSRVDTKYFHSFVLPYADIEFIKGRLRFVDLDNSSPMPSKAPFPSILCHYRHKG